MIEIEHAAILEGPDVQWKHVDGPLLSWGGLMHWLTWRERLCLFLGLTSVDRIACAKWPYLDSHRERLRAANK